MLDILQGNSNNGIPTFDSPNMTDNELQNILTPHQYHIWTLYNDTGLSYRELAPIVGIHYTSIQAAVEGARKRIAKYEQDQQAEQHDKERYIISRLTKKQIEVLALYYFDCMTLAQIQDATGNAERTIVHHLRNGRDTLAKHGINPKRTFPRMKQIPFDPFVLGKIVDEKFSCC